MLLFYTFQTTNLDHPVEIEQAGGKGLSLIEAAQKGFRVPPAMILPHGFFAPWFKKIKASTEWKALKKASPKELKKAAKAVAKKATALTFSAVQKKSLSEIKKFMQEKKFSLVAVRSSSPEEDLESISFAGIYESELGVSEKNLEKAIKKCFISSLSERVIVYKREHGLDPFDPKIAVIIQKQLASDVAGVAFSLNPVNNCYDEAIINANYGLGKTVVDGSVTPDHFVIDKIKHTISEKTLGSKNLSEYLTSGGRPVIQKENRADEFCLTDIQVREVAALAIKVESAYGKPMDIEWAYEEGRLYLLQARPITGYIKLPPRMVTAPGERKKLYLNGMLAKQGLTASMSPLGTATFQQITRLYGGIAALFDKKSDLSFIEAGRFYMSAGALSRVVGKKGLIGMFASVDLISGKILEGLDLKEYEPKQRAWGLLGALLKTSFAAIKPMLTGLKAYRKPDEYLAHFKAKIKELETDLLHEPDMKTPFDQYCEITYRKVIDFMFGTSIGTLFASEVARAQIKKMFKSEPQEIQDQIPYLEQAMENNITIEMGLHLYDLSQFTDIKKIKKTDDFLKKLGAKKFSSEFHKSWDEFMRLYGHRYPTELDMGSPRYREKPDEIFTLLKTMEAVKKPEMTPHGIFARGKQKRKETYEFFLKHLTGRGEKQLEKFKKLYKILETFSAYRELHKYYIVVAIDKIHQRALEFGKKWAKTKRLDFPEQVFQLEIEQLLEAQKNSKMKLVDLAEKNRAWYKQFDYPHRPTTLIDSRGRIPSMPREFDYTGGEKELVGTPVSPGIAIGPAKVLKRPDEKPVMPGDILVAYATNPGWTTLFLNASGVLLENGGTLQHGACVARESCKPCVVGIHHATAVIEDGMMLELNGSTGVVKILD